MCGEKALNWPLGWPRWGPCLALPVEIQPTAFGKKQGAFPEEARAALIPTGTEPASPPASPARVRLSPAAAVRALSSGSRRPFPSLPFSALPFPPLPYPTRVLFT